MGQPAQWGGTASIKGSTESMQMALLTCSLIGLQFTWGIEMTYCTPYLLQLGLTKSGISLVWIAGPLSGLIMQPIVGVVADRSRSPWGRRRPFMVIGTVIVSACLLILGWTKEIVGHFVTEEEAKREITIALAVLSIYGVDFAINAVQASCRSLVVDTLPIPKQQLGSAWATRMIAAGSLVGYGAGAVDLRIFFGTMLGDTQFKQLTAVAALTLCMTIGITSWAVTERILISDGKENDGSQGAMFVLNQIFKTATNLPPRISIICWTQFWCWIGWFPFLFYSTTWIGEIYMRYDAPAETRNSPDTLGQIGRIGSTSLIVFSIVTCIGSVVFPWLIKSPDEEKPAFTPRPPSSIASFLIELEKYKPSLLTAWQLSHLVFAFSMILAPFVRSLRSATILVALCGIPWALGCWAPWTFMGMEINRLSNVPSSSTPSTDPHRRSASLSRPSIELKPLQPSPSPDSGSAGETSGIYLGILNLYCTLPQFVGTAISWAVFSILEPGKSPELAKEVAPGEHHGTEGPNAIAVCLFIGACAAGGAAFATGRLRGLG
ncbi:sucrose transport protein SUC2 [Patellaria atrata CBS 101060]|uniref:Sucrose transport protein SUC2 n=1 Tax=Patellaria atrata CBS 101060 TaxID=1346257 RepID=A0A9P4VTK5_9PEZI|nr:sucrose transport protein SUC2 [Patellaria atrata CBS 101060]